MFSRPKITRTVFGALLAVVSLQGLVIFNLSRIAESSQKARLYRPQDETTATELMQLKREVISRAALYNTLIERDMLVDGMVVDRDGHGKATHLCDSLLFSALRYRSLLALGFEDAASGAWEALNQSRNQGQWWRHPLCSQNSLSRDMLMGVLVGLEGNPPDAKTVLEELLTEINERRGSFSDGPFFVSYLSPGPAGLLRHFAEFHRIPYGRWPWVLKQSFSSVEFDALFIKPGYESHLAALGLWLEQRFAANQTGFNARSALGEIDRFFTRTPSNRVTDIDRQRMMWVSDAIAKTNPANLFFESLWFEVRGQLTDQIKIKLLSKLLAMPQFPPDRLPMDCDKDADYLWQRKMEEYKPATSRCKVTYSGVDFLWMAGVLGHAPKK